MLETLLHPMWDVTCSFLIGNLDLSHKNLLEFVGTLVNIYIYIYIYVCVCVCKRLRLVHFLMLSKLETLLILP